MGPDTFYCGPVLRTVRAQTNFKSYQWQDASTLDYIVAQAAGKYKLNIVSADGCLESDSMTIFQFPVLDPGLGNDTQICISSFIDLTAISGMNNYLWSTGETSQAIRSYLKGKFTVLVKNSIGCIAEDSIIVDLEHQVMEPCRQFSITITNSQSLYISQKNEGEDF